MDFEAAFSFVKEASESQTSRRKRALVWREKTSTPVAVAWLPKDFATDPANAPLWDVLLSERTNQRLRAAMEHSEPGWPRRAASIANEHFALPVVVEQALGVGGQVSGVGCRVSGSGTERIDSTNAQSSTPTSQRPNDPTTQSSTPNTQHPTPIPERPNDPSPVTRHPAPDMPVTRHPAPGTRYLTPDTLYLSHTPLGQPLVRWRGKFEEWAQERGISHQNMHISFTHDGDAHIAAAAFAPGLRGIGVDVVYMPRLRKSEKGLEYLHRFARHFMSGEEYEGFKAAAQGEELEQVLCRVSAHFSLMEAASKALGTGLKIGAGMGGAESLPKQSLGVERLQPDVQFLLTPDAEARCNQLRGTFLEGHWSFDEEYLVSIVLLWGESRNP
jgi:phosphopantetheinyl transferase (holo-ACP synthase)